MSDIFEVYRRYRVEVGERLETNTPAVDPIVWRFYARYNDQQTAQSRADSLAEKEEFVRVVDLGDPLAASAPTEPVNTDCSACGKTNEECLRGIRTTPTGKACCPRCAYTDTHNQFKVPHD